MYRNFTYAILLVCLVYAGIFLGGCAVVGTNDAIGFNEFINSDFKPYKSCGNKDLDRIGASTSKLAQATHVKLKAYVNKCDNNAVFTAYQNDINLCAGPKPTDAMLEQCTATVNASLSPENQSAIAAFLNSTSSENEAMMKQFEGLAEITGAILDFSNRGTDAFKGDFLAVTTQVGAFGEIQGHLATLIDSQKYLNTQKKMMDSFSSHKGR